MHFESFDGETTLQRCSKVEDTVDGLHDRRASFINRCTHAAEQSHVP